MKLLANSRKVGFVLATGIFSLVLVTTVSSQEAQPEKARALLDQVKKSDLDRQITAKQTEIERLKEDQAKTQRDSSGLQQTINSTTELIADGVENLGKLSFESKRLEHELAVAEARINAERLKIEGLRALSTAQGKSLSALTRRLEEADARTQMRTAELDLLQEGKPVPAEGREEKAQAELSKRRKTLSLAESKTQSEERLAHDAMKAAASKMVLAEARAATAKRLSDIDPTAVPTPIIAEKPKTKLQERQSERNGGEIPVRRAVPASPLAPVVSTPPASATSKPVGTGAAKPSPTAIAPR